MLIVDVDANMLRRRVEHRYLDEIADDYDDAVRRVTAAATERRALSVGLVGNAADVLPRLLRDGVAAASSWWSPDHSLDPPIRPPGSFIAGSFTARPP